MSSGTAIQHYERANMKTDQPAVCRSDVVQDHPEISKCKQLHFVCPTMSMEESISLEETNKIRISLGLKPLTEDKEPEADEDKQAEQNYALKREQEAKEREAK
jgi:hypothetical protein